MIKSNERIPLFLFWLKGYVKVLLITLLFMSGFRLLWFLHYRRGDELSGYPLDLMKAAWLGARFDLSAFCHLSLPSFLIWLVWLLLGPSRWAPTLLRLQRRLWIFLLLFLSLILAADFAFYGYFQDHLNVLIFGLIQDDTNAILKTVWRNYPILKILLGIYFLYRLTDFGLTRLWGHLSIFNLPAPRWRRSLVACSFLAVGLGARGTLGLFPLEIMHTAISSHAFINTLSFNGAHAFVRALQIYEYQRQNWNENLLRLGYQKAPEQALIDFAGHPLNSSAKPWIESVTKRTGKKKTFSQTPHVVVLLMESWGSDWMTFQTPHFDVLGAFAAHKDADLFTPDLMPSSVATIGSLGSLAVDLPHRLYSPFLTESSYLHVAFSTAPARLFKSQGYQTHFIYGGNPGWRSIDKFLPRQGFDVIHGDQQIREKFQGISEAEIFHDWGVYDEFVFQYAEKLLTEAKQPQFLFILTTSNHPPYTLPPHFEPLPLDFSAAISDLLIGDKMLDQDRLKVYQYANQQLGLFMNSLKSGPLAAKTIVAATGDHSFYIRSYDKLEILEKWSVPFYLYIPDAFKDSARKTLSIGNHIDIFPTLYNLVFSEVTYKSFGSDLLAAHHRHWAYHAPSWTSFDEKHGVILSPSGQILSALCRDKAKHFYSCHNQPDHENLQRRLNSMMGSADFLFKDERDSMEEKKNE